MSHLGKKWSTGKLGDHFELKNGVNFSADQRGSGILTLDVKNMYGTDAFVDPSGLYRVAVDPGERVLNEDDILFVRSSVKREGVGWASAFKTFDEPVAFCGFLIRARARIPNYFDPRFLVYYLRLPYVRDQLVSSSGQVAITNISQENLAKLPIPLPPLAEQKRIAGILDAADALRAKRRESLAQLDTLLQSTFLEMFGDPVTNPMGWEVTAIGTHIKVLGGFAFKSADFTEQGLPIIRISNLAGDSINLANCARIPASALGKGARFKLQPGDTLIAMSGATTGKLGFVPDDLDEEWYLNQRVGAFRIPDGSVVNQQYLRALLQSSFYQDHVWNLAGGAAQPNISGKQLESAQIPLPPLDLQHRFAAIVESVEQQKASQRAHLEELDTLFASLQSRAFQGEL